MMALLSSRMDNNMEQFFKNNEEALKKPLENLEDLLGGEAKEEIDIDFDQNLNKCLSMILHHEDIKKMAEIVKKIHSQKTGN